MEFNVEGHVRYFVYTILDCHVHTCHSLCNLQKAFTAWRELLILKFEYIVAK